jgi:hypothetical protein
MSHIDSFFKQSAYQWNLDTLYGDLASIKGKRLTPVEKLHLRGLLCGYSPTEIAEQLHKSIKGVEVDLCNTVYQYVKILVDKSNGKVDNWRNITEWLEEAGYKNQSSVQYSVDDSLSLNLVVKKAKISIEKNQLLIDINIRLATPLPPELPLEEEIEIQNDINP